MVLSSSIMSGSGLFSYPDQPHITSLMSRRKHTSMSKEEEAKLLYGMLFSLKSFSAKLSPVDMKQGFSSYKTNVYRLTLFETPSSKCCRDYFMF